MRILGIDWGEKRIGLAISDENNIVALALDTIENKKASLDKIKKIINENDIGIVVIGLPLSMKGSITKKAKEVLRFAQKLKKTLNKPIYLWDERLSSKEVEKLLISANIKREKRKKIKDKLSAVLILQSFLERRS